MLFRLIMTIYMMSISFAIQADTKDNRPLRILHVPSYHMSWEWNINQLQGFKDGLGDLNAEYKIVALDTKRASSPKDIAKKVEQAKAVVTNWQPDLLYTNDDNAQKYFTQSYVNTDLPIVFSAVNRAPSEYQFLGSSNVTGVMEYEHFIPTVNLLRTIKKDINRIAVIIDSDPTWKGVVTRMKASLKDNPDIEVSNWYLVETFEDYKNIINELQTRVDAVALLGIFNLKDQQNKDVDYKEVLKWTAKNSQLPDFSYWESRVDEGTLCAVAVSGYQQGHLAGEMARKILLDGVSPSAMPFRASDKGEPMISLSRAKDLGLKLNVQLLLNNKIKKKYAWDD